MPPSFRSFAVWFIPLLVVLMISPLVAQDPADTPDDLLTVAEASNYEATSVSHEVNRFLQACDDRADHVSHWSA